MHGVPLLWSPRGRLSSSNMRTIRDEFAEVLREGSRETIHYTGEDRTVVHPNEMPKEMLFNAVEDAIVQNDFERGESSSVSHPIETRNICISRAGRSQVVK